MAQFGHGSELTGPVEFEDTGSVWPTPGSLFTTASQVAFRAKYADGVIVGSAFVRSLAESLTLEDGLEHLRAKVAEMARGVGGSA